MALPIPEAPPGQRQRKVAGTSEDIVPVTMATFPAICPICDGSSCTSVIFNIFGASKSEQRSQRLPEAHVGRCYAEKQEPAKEGSHRQNVFGCGSRVRSLKPALSWGAQRVHLQTLHWDHVGRKQFTKGICRKEKRRPKGEVETTSQNDHVTCFPPVDPRDS